MSNGRAFDRARRGLLIGAGAVAVCVPGALAEQHIAFVSRDRILRESQVGTRILKTEQSLTTALQGAIDAATATLDAEEAALTEERPNLSEEQFKERSQVFDQRVRQMRRSAQERANILQRVFQELRAQLVARLPELLEEVRLEAGVVVILSADQVLAADPAVDLTERAIALFNDETYAISIPELDMSAPLLPTP